jgi:plastocyanin
MRKQLLICVSISGLAATGLLVWHQPARAADDVKTIHIVFPGPVFDEPNAIITAGQSIKWEPKPQEGGTPHHLFQIDGTGKEIKEITPEFNGNDFETATQKFDRSGPTINYHCKIHPTTMIGTTTVKPK